MIHRPIDHRSARTRHPHVVTLYLGLDLATVAVLLEEGVEASEDGHTLLALRLARGPRCRGGRQNAPKSPLTAKTSGWCRRPLQYPWHRCFAKRVAGYGGWSPKRPRRRSWIPLWSRSPSSPLVWKARRSGTPPTAPTGTRRWRLQCSRTGRRLQSPMLVVGALPLAFLGAPALHADTFVSAIDTNHLSVRLNAGDPGVSSACEAL